MDEVERVARAMLVRRYDGVTYDVWAWAKEETRREYLADARAAIAAMQKPGYVLVPVEPSEAMLAAADATGALDNGVLVVSDISLATAYRAMIEESQK